MSDNLNKRDQEEEIKDRLKGLKRIQAIATRNTPFIFAYELESKVYTYHNFERLFKDKKFDHKALFGYIGLDESKPVFDGENILRYEKTGKKYVYYWHEILPNDNSISDCRLIFDIDVDTEEKMEYFIRNKDKILEAYEIIILKTFNHFIFSNINRKSKEDVIKELEFNWLITDNPNKVGYHLVVLNILICGDRPEFFELFYEIMNEYADEHTIFDFLRDKNESLSETLVDRHLQIRNHSVRLPGMYKRDKMYEYKSNKGYKFGDSIATVGMENKKDKEKGNYVMVNDEDELTKEIRLKLKRNKNKYLTEIVNDNIPENYIELLEKHIPLFNEMWKLYKINNNKITFTNINKKHKCDFVIGGRKCNKIHTSNTLDVTFNKNKIHLKLFIEGHTKDIEWRNETEEDKKDIKKYTKKEKKEYYKQKEDIKAQIAINEIKPLILKKRPFSNWKIIKTKRIYDNETKVNILGCKRNLLLLSKMDTGKTYALFTHIKDKKYDSILIFCKLRRQGRMLAQQAKQFGLNFTYYEGLSEDEINDAKYIICSIESIHKLKNKVFDLIVMDESEGLLANFRSKITHGSNIGENVKRFDQLVRKCNRIICMDANISDKSRKFLRDINKECDTIINEFTPSKPPIQMVREKNEKGKYNFKVSYEKFINMFINDLKNGKNAVLVMASCEKLKTFLNDYKSVLNNYIGLAYYGDSKPVQFNINCDPFDVENWGKCVFVLYSPTISEGISFDKVHFDNVYLYASSYGPTAKVIIQMLGRIRKCNMVYCCMYDHKVGNVSITSKDVMNDILYKEDKVLDEEFYTLNELNRHLEKPPRWLMNVFKSTIQEDNLQKDGYFYILFRMYAELSGYTFINEDVNIEVEKIEKDYSNVDEKKKYKDIPDITKKEYEEILYLKKHDCDLTEHQLEIFDKHTYKQYWTTKEETVMKEIIYDYIWHKNKEYIKNISFRLKCLKDESYFKYKLDTSIENSKYTIFADENLLKYKYYVKLMKKIGIDCMYENIKITREMLLNAEEEIIECAKIFGKKLTLKGEKKERTLIECISSIMKEWDGSKLVGERHGSNKKYTTFTVISTFK